MNTTYAWLGAGLIILIIGGLLILNNGQAPASSPAGSSATTSPVASAMTLTSAAFLDGASIPLRYTCDATPPGTNPPLSISGVPKEAVSLTLIMDDPDVPTQVLAAGVYDHWVLFNMAPATSEIAASSTVGTVGANGSGKNAYAAPCPPPQYEPSEHRYYLRLYALDTGLALGPGATKQQVLDAMKGHIISQATLIGKYKRIPTK